MFSIPWIQDGSAFPPIDRALRDPNGLLAAGGDLSPPRLLSAYSQGIFPWYSHGQPILWWSPDPRMVLVVSDAKFSRSLTRTIRKGSFEIRVDTAFDQVINACAKAVRRGQVGTWITPEIAVAYRELHRLGIAHSVESWRGNQLVGGLYGLSIGRVFFGESMFACETDASKVALAGLVTLARRADIPIIDCQQETSHLASFGARPISRNAFSQELTKLIGSKCSDRDWPNGKLMVDL